MINISIPNLPKFKKALAKYPQFSAKEVKVAFEKSLLEIIRETAPLTPVDTGRLLGSIGSTSQGIYKVEKNRATVGTNVQYAVHVHEGFQKHRLGTRQFLLKGAKAAVPKIQGFFKDAYNNIFTTIAKESK